MGNSNTNRCIQVLSLSEENTGDSKWDKLHECGRRVYSPDGVAPTIHTCGGGNIEPKVIIKIEF